MLEECSVSLIGEQDTETIGEFYSRVQSVIEAFNEIGTSQEEIGDFFEFSDSGVVDKREKHRSELLESAIEATEENTRTGAINEQVQAIKSIELAKMQKQKQENR